MFFKLLYRFHKIGCVCCILLLLAFIWINFKWGVVASPVSHYGMYSGSYHLSDTVMVTRVKANQVLINPSHLSLVERDILQAYPSLFLNEQTINRYVFNTMYPFFNKVGLGSLLTPDKFSNRATQQQYETWYKNKLESFLATPVHQVEIYSQGWIWKNKQPQLVSVSPKQIID